MSGCATCPPAPQTGRPPAPEPAPYMRVAYPDSDTVELQIAVRQFTPRRRSGPVIWLAGASHIGEPAYYAALQRHLDQQALVLYEGIKGLGDSAPPGSSSSATVPQHREAFLEKARRLSSASLVLVLENHPPSRAKASQPDKPNGANRIPSHALRFTAAESAEAAAGDSLQIGLARSLGLVFQLDALNYRGPRYRNSDLSAAQLQDLMQARDHSQPSPDGAPPETAFDDLVQTMQGTSLLGAVAHAIVEFLGGSPRLRALTKLAMIEMLGQFKGDLSQVEALPPDLRQLMAVLIRERNQAVIADLKSTLRAPNPPASIAVIYGAAHLDDLERRLRRELRYCPAGDLWLPAFSVNTARAGLTGFEIGLVRTVVRAQIKMLQRSLKD